MRARALASRYLPSKNAERDVGPCPGTLVEDDPEFGNSTPRPSWQFIQTTLGETRLKTVNDRPRRLGLHHADPARKQPVAKSVLLRTPSPWQFACPTSLLRRTAGTGQTTDIHSHGHLGSVRLVDRQVFRKQMSTYKYNFFWKQVFRTINFLTIFFNWTDFSKATFSKSFFSKKFLQYYRNPLDILKYFILYQQHIKVYYLRKMEIFKSGLLNTARW